MSTQIMGSQGCVGNPSVSNPLSLSRQVSLYSLTLDEVQNQLASVGKPLSSMNLDELLRNVWIVEEANQSLGAGNVGKDTRDSSLNCRSSFSLSRDLRRKTVDEVLREIHRGKKSGEMTLEDFLVQAGIVLDAAGGRENSSNNNNGNIDRDNSGVLEPNKVVDHAHWMQYPLIPQQQEHSMMTMFTLDPSLMCDTQTAGRKRVASGVVVEKTVERRQKRMIKNRESAARSRARKEAYTNELENKVSRLEEENERLRRMREAEKALPSVPTPQPKYQLRRTSSATF